MRIAALIAVLFVGACGATIPLPPGPVAEPTAPAPTGAAAEAAATRARSFLAVIDAVEPVAEDLCRERRIAQRCDFQIVVDSRPGMPPNAFQTLDSQGRPIIGLTLALIFQAKNPDELAFVLGHEAGHHIAGHIPQQRDQVMFQAMLAGVQARAQGLPDQAVKAAQTQAAMTAIRSFSQRFELEADAIGAEIALLAGFDPIRGSDFFDRLPNPGNRMFFATHPPNDQRKAVVRATVNRLRGN